jgi:hypothetical protein
MINSDIVFDLVEVIKLDVNLWSARKKLRPEDLILADGSKLPPDSLASLGSKKMIDSERIAVFDRLKKEAERLCLQSGVRFLGGYAIPKQSIPGILSEMERISQEFYQAKSLFLRSYENAVEEWINRLEFEDFRDAIRRAVEPVESIGAKLGFDYVVFRVSKPDDETTLNKRADTLSDTLFTEIAKEASDLINDSLLGKQLATRRALSPIKRIRAKLDGLSFLDRRVLPLIDMIDELLSSVTIAGPIQGHVFNRLFATALILSDPDKMKKHGDGLTGRAAGNQIKAQNGGCKSRPAWDCFSLQSG